MSFREKYNLVPFVGEDFSNWCFRIKSILRESQVEDAIADSEFHKKATNKKDEYRAQAIIIAGVSNSHLEYIKNKESAYEMFKNLEDNFKKKGVRSRLFLRRQLSDMRYNERESLAKHFVSMEEVFSQLKDADCELSEDEKINYVLLSMPKGYDNVITAIETMENLTLDFIKNRLMGEEEKRNKGNRTSKCEFRNPDFAFSCFICGQKGHKKYQCPSKNVRQYNKSKYSSNSGRPNTNDSSPVQRHKYGNRQGSNWRKYQDGAKQAFFSAEDKDRQPTPEHPQILFYSEENVSEESVKSVESVNVSSEKVPDKLLWVIDSGATSHMVSSDKLFSESIKLKQPKKISVAKNGSTIEAEQVGNIDCLLSCNNLLKNCSIKNVYFVPNVSKNLLSVCKLEEAGYSVIFENDRVFIKDKNNILATGYKSNSLYFLETFVSDKFESCNLADNDELFLWHCRYGHLGVDSLKKVVNMVDGVNIKTNNGILCESCMYGKMCRTPFNKKCQRASKPLELVHTDVCGPISPSTWDGKRYFVTFIDDYTHFTMVYLMASKDEVVKHFITYHNFVTNFFKSNIIKLRSDNGGEYVCNELREFCRVKGIKIHYTIAYNPEMNSIAERMNRTLLDRARTMLIHSKTLDKQFWGEAVLTATHITNRSPTSCLDKTPYEMWEGKKPSVSYMRIFGCVAYSHIPQQLRKKLDSRSQKLVMVGYSPGGYRLWDEANYKVVEARHVKFDERSNAELIVSTDIPGRKDENEIDVRQEDKEISDVEIVDQSSIDFENTNGEVRTTERLGKRTIRKPKRLLDYVTDFDETNDDSLFALLIQSEDDVPLKFEDIDSRNDNELWKEAVKEELKTLNENETWEIVETPNNVKLIDSKWVFTKKYVNNNSVCKARLVAKGFQQVGEFDDIYSPVVKLQTLRILLSVSVHRKYDIHQMDVKGAFLYGEMKENVYLKSPPGVHVKSGFALKLRKALYGLKKSPKYWYEKFSKLMKEYGFIRSENDYCLYIRDNLYVLLFVDDLLILSNNMSDVKLLKQFLCSNFKMKDLGSNNLKYLGITIVKEGNNLFIDQRDYLECVLKRFGMTDCRAVDTPMDVSAKLEENCSVNVELEAKCRACIGSLMYAMVASRPDLATAVGYLSRFQSKPSVELWCALKRVLRYVKGSLHLRLKYCKFDKSEPLVGYADANYARDSDRKSTSGCLFQVFGNTVAWRSKKQSVVALSTTEAEFISLSEAAVEGLWIKKILCDLRINCNSITLYEDNQSTIKSVKNPEQKRLKHIDIKYNFIKQEIESGNVIVVYVSSQNQLADVLTKPLGKVAFGDCIDKLGLTGYKD